MSNKCAINQQSLKDIKNMTARVARLFRKTNDTQSLKNDIIELCKDLSKLYELSEVKSISDAVVLTAERYGISERIPNLFDRQNIENLITAYTQNIQINDIFEVSTKLITDLEQVRNRLEALREFLDDAYGLARDVLIYVQNKTNLHLFDCLFINRGSVNLGVGIVKNTHELNNNIREYQNYLLKLITDYLRSVKRNSPNLKVSSEVSSALRTLMYDNNNKYTGVLEIINEFANDYLTLSPDLLTLLFNTINDNTLSLGEREQAQLRLDAYNARVILNNFDAYLDVILGKAIQIKDPGRKTGEDKYQISSSTANKSTTWRRNENIDVSKEADVITKLAINTTPLLKWQSDIPTEGLFLYFSDFQHIIAKIKDLSYNASASSKTLTFDEDFLNDHTDLWESLSENTQKYLDGKTLREAITYLRINPRRYLPAIFEILSHRDMKSIAIDIYSKFTNDELNKLYSLSRGVFNGPNSIYTLAGNSIDNDYCSYISQTADSIFNVKYVLYYRDEGNILIRTLNDLGVNNLKRGIEQTINIRNSSNLIKNWEYYKNSLNLTEIKAGEKHIGIQFTIPGTDFIAKVFIGGGDVSISLNGTAIDFASQFDNVLPFIDKVLNLNLKNNQQLKEETIRQIGDLANTSKSLVSFASRVILNQYVLNEFIKNTPRNELDNTINSLYGRNAPSYNYSLDELNLVHGNDIHTLNQIANAKANIYGLTTSVQVKDGEGNGQSQQTFSRLLGSLQSLFDLQERRLDSVTNELMLLNTPGFFEGVFTAKEFYDLSDGTKPFTKMSVSEMAYSQLVYDFIGGLIPRDKNHTVGNGHCFFLPSVNSDKNTIGRILTNLNKGVPEITTTNLYGQKVIKPLKDYTAKEYEWLISRELGKVYTKMFDKINSDWKTLEQYLNNIGFKVTLDYKSSFKEFNEWFEQQGFEGTPAEFIKKYTLQYNQSNRLHPLELTDLVHYKNVKGQLVPNEVIISQVARFNPSRFENDPKLLSKYPTATEFWYRKKEEVLKTLLKSNFRINTTNTELEELKYIRDNYKSWINPSGDVMLAKVNGIPVTSSRDLLKLGGKPMIDIELNPLIDKYNYLDYLITLEFMLCTVGSFVAHPEKSKSTDVLVQEAAQFQALHKRNVSFTAAMYEFQLNLLNGIPSLYNIAVVEDVYDELGVANGSTNSLKPFDGATYVNPFVVVLENNSLDGYRAGITKKLFVHFKNHTLGTGGIIKTAGFGLTNDWTRNSPFLLKMMKKMTNHVWLNEDGSEAIVDITTSYTGEKIVYQDIYFSRDGKNYKVTDIRSLGNNLYERRIVECTTDGNPIGNEIIEPAVTVRTNYDLYNLFGGKDSKSIKNNFLEYSNTSVENVVIAMNNTAGQDSSGNIITKNRNIQTLEDLWQPLKLVDVHYVVTTGAIKQGGANINSSKRYFDDIPYDILRIFVNQAGILLDKEHHADESDISLMTLVISACAAKGYTFEQACKLYEGLKKITDVKAKKYLDSYRELFTDGTVKSMNDFQEVIIETIIKSLSTSKTSTSFASTLAKNLMKQAREGKNIKFADSMLPLSDNTVYSKIVSTIASFLTNTGIKLDIPGLLSVLTPSFGVMKLYGDRKYESFTNPEQELEQLQQELIPLFTTSYNWQEGQTSFLGLLIDYVEPNSLISSQDGLPVAMNNPHDGRVLVDLELMRAKFQEKAWRHPRNSKAIDYDFLTFEEWMLFALLHEKMHDIYFIQPGESRFDYETRINEQALRRLTGNISDIELGREYFITREVEIKTEMEIPETGEIVMVPVTELITISEFIGTPSQYYQLKKDIQDGVVFNVVENVTAGRDLAGYNVRFKTLEGGRFLLWDLYSAEILFKLNDLKDNWKGTEKNIEKLKLLYRDAYNQELDLLEDALDFIDRFIIYTRRTLQNDLLNLSRGSNDTLKLFGELIKERLYNEEYYRKFAQWVNVKLGNPDGSQIRINGELTTITDENLHDVVKEVYQWLQNTTKVRIGNQLFTVDKASIKELAYECIIPKVFASAFALKEFDDINTIKNDPDFFIKLYLRNQATKVLDNQYSVEFKTLNGNHIYLTQKKFVSNLHKVQNILTVEEDGKTYRIDSLKNILYEITPDTEIYQDDQGNEVIVSDDIEFYVNSLSYNGLKLSNNLFNYPSTLNKILETFASSKNRIASRFYKLVTSLGKWGIDIQRMLDGLNSVTLDNYKELPESHPIIREGRMIYNSFLKSLNIVATRTPSQSMQSFMPMKVVAFDNPDINTAYVSTYQILLLGSDYRFYAE